MSVVLLKFVLNFVVPELNCLLKNTIFMSLFMYFSLMASVSEENRKKVIDWDKFGLVTPSHGGNSEGCSYGTDGHQPTDANELFAGEQVKIC